MQDIKMLGFQPLPKLAIALPEEAIADICKRWKIEELYLFGSILRNDFHTDSDVDVMIEFSPNAHWGWDIVLIKDELEAALARKVDLLTKKSIERSCNNIRKEEILASARLVYVTR